MKKLIMSACLFLTVTLTNAVNVRLAWDYPEVERSSDIQFRLYHSTDLSTWSLVQTIPHDATEIVLPVTLGPNFYTMRAYSIFWETESDPSNTASTPAVPRATVLTITKQAQQ